MKLKTVWNRLKSFAGTTHGKQVLIASGIAVITVAVIIGILVYIHSRSLADADAKANHVSISSMSTTSSDSVDPSSSNNTASGTQVSSSTPSTADVAVQSITLNQTNIALKVGQTAQLSVKVEPDNATSKAVTWSSSDRYTAAVNSGGIVTAGQTGTAYIYAKTANGVSEKCKVTITASSTGGSGNGSTGTGKSGGGTGESTGGSTGGGGSGGGGSTGGGGSSTPSGSNLAGLATYGNYPYPYGVAATHAEFVQKSPQNDCNKIASDLIAEYKSEGYSFDTCAGNVYVSQANVIRGYLSGHGQSHVVDVAWNYNGSTYYHWNVIILS